MSDCDFRGGFSSRPLIPTLLLIKVGGGRRFSDIFVGEFQI